MQRTSASTIGAIGFVILVLGLTWCSNPFKHFNHTGGIAYYKQGVLPYANKEIDGRNVPFSISGGTKTAAIVGTQIAVIPVNADSVGITFTTGGQHYSYIQKINKELSTAFFSITITPKLGDWPDKDHDIYFFKFVKEQPVPVHPYIRYFVRNPEAGAGLDITDTTPFKISFSKYNPSILNQPVEVHALTIGADTTIYFCVSYSNGTYIVDYAPHASGETQWTPDITLIVSATRPFTSADLGKTYFFTLGW